MLEIAFTQTSVSNIFSAGAQPPDLHWPSSSIYYTSYSGTPHFCRQIAAHDHVVSMHRDSQK